MKKTTTTKSTIKKPAAKKLSSTRPVMKVDKDGNKIWKLNNKYHREDGPAVERANGDKQWFLEDKEYSENDWKKKVAEMKNKPSSQPSIKKADNNEQSELISALQDSLAHYRHQSEELAKTLSVYKEHSHCYKALHAQAIEVIAELRSQIEGYRERDRRKIDTSLSRS